LANILQTRSQSDSSLINGKGQFLVRVDADEPGFAGFEGRFSSAITGKTSHTPEDISILIIDHGKSHFLGSGGVNITVDIAGVHFDFGVGSLCAEQETIQEVVDDGAVNAAHKTNNSFWVDVSNTSFGGHFASESADQITHVVLLVGDIDNILVDANISVVIIDQEFLIRISGGSFLQVIRHLVGAADYQVVLTAAGNFVQGFEPFRLILISAAHFDGLVGDATCIG